MKAHITPGPWRVAEWTCHAATTVLAGDPKHPIVVAECSGHDGRYATESLGDARAIAALPDLLDVAKRAEAHLARQGWVVTDDGGATQQLRHNSWTGPEHALPPEAQLLIALRAAIAKATGDAS